ncbi:MAG: four helix bundle protein [Planctomycetes bacterium]|nr:four helix bundle protein [Planctomycetota bacterium]
MPFHAETVALQLVTALRGPLERVRAQDANLADQGRRAAQSIALNTAEGNGRQGRDRARHFTYAYGSGRELRAVLAIAEADGQVSAVELAEARELLDRVLAMLWRLVHPRR